MLFYRKDQNKSMSFEVITLSDSPTVSTIEKDNYPVYTNTDEKKYADELQAISISDVKKGKIIFNTLFGSIHLIEILEQPFAAKLSHKTKIPLRKISPESPENEIEIMKKIPYHPNVLPLCYHLETDEYYMCVTPYINGCDMLDYLLSFGKMDEQMAKKYVIQLLEAVKHLHQNYVYHLDLSPENLLLYGDKLKVFDFGSSIYGNPENNGMIMINSIRPPGKKFYRAPEMLRRGYVNGAKADIYSIGCVVFSMLTEKPLYGSESLKDKYYCYLQEFGFIKYYKKFWYECNLSEDAVDFMNELMKPVNIRITMEEALNHSWLK